MSPKAKIALSFSGGKDSAMALHALRSQGEYEVAALLTTIAQPYDRISHHGVRRVMLERQAEAAGLPLHPIMLPADRCSNEDYEALMRAALERLAAQGVTAVAFGDIYLADLRAWREQNLAKIGMRAVFPLWGRDTTDLVRDFVALGFKAVLVAVDGRRLDRSFAGRALDLDLLRDLPAGVDPCGENGEYHSFVFDGPIFSRPVPTEARRTVERDVRFFTDVASPGDPEDGTPDLPAHGVAPSTCAPPADGPCRVDTPGASAAAPGAGAC
jgi:uncharacterized protein (TIGR00290 family)